MDSERSTTRTEGTGISRRAFLGGSAVAFGTIMLSGALGTATGCSTGSGAAGGSGSSGAENASATAAFELYDTEILIIGGGLAGSHAALQAHKQGKDVAVVEKGPFHFGGACGYNWCNWVNFIQTDTPWDQSEDFVLNELTNKKIAKATHEAFTVEERNLLLRYAQEGNNLFVRDEDGTFAPGLDMPGYPLFGTFNGFPRYFTDSVERTGARIFDHTMITDVIIEDGACIGAVGLHIPTGVVRVFRAKATISCTGASSWIYGWNTVAPTSINSPDNTGDVDAAAYRRGAALQDSEFFQFDLISMYPMGLAATFVGGIGADNLCCEYICDANDTYFFRGMDYSTLDRITFTRTIAKAIHDGGGSPNGGVYVDFSNPEAFAAMGEVYRRNVELWREVFGIDVASTKLECALEAYEHGGNPRVDENLMVEGMPGLFCSRGGGVYGAQGGSSVNVAYRDGSYAMMKAIEYAEGEGAKRPASFAFDAIEEEINRLHELRLRQGGGKRPQEVTRMIQKAAYQACQPTRETEAMQQAVDELARIRSEELPNMTLGDTTLTYNTDWKAAIEACNLLDIAEASSRAALMREESRGHSYRPEYPEENPGAWTCNIVARNVDGAMQLETVPVVELD